MNTVLISGSTDQVGKTIVLRALNAYWKRYRANQRLGTMVIPCLEAGATLEHPDLAHLWWGLSQQQQDHDGVLVEGEGGLGAPVTFDTTIAALARDWRLPTLLVVPTEWAAIAPAVAAIALARQTRLELIGVIFNQRRSPASESNPGEVVNGEDNEAIAAFRAMAGGSEPELAALLRSLTQVPILGTIPFLTDPHDDDALAQAASNLVLERLFRQDMIYA